MRSMFCDGLTRRDTLRIGALGAFGLTWSDVLRARALSAAPETPSVEACLFVNLAGGPSHLDTWDMKPDGPSETRGPFASIDTQLAGLQVCEHLPKFAQIADRYCLLRGFSHSAGAHPQAQSYMSTGNRPGPAVIYPSFGSVMMRERPSRSDLPSYVAIPVTEWNPGYLGDAFAPFKTSRVPTAGQPFQVRGISLADGVTLDQVRRRDELLSRVDRLFRDADAESPLLDALDQFGRQSHEMITSAHAQSAFDVSREPESIRNRFANDELGQSLLLSVRLIEHGVRFITVTNAGWDTHTDNFTGHQRLLGPLDSGLAALVPTLEEKGLLEKTLVVVMGEFGRTPKINQNSGRDHYPRVGCSLLTGGGVQTGQIIGGSDAGGEAVAGDTEITPDNLAASIYQALGVDHHLEYETSGRPIQLVAEGESIPGLFA